MTAEKKFAKSITQLVTVKSEDSIGLCLASLHNIAFGNFSFVPKPLQLGDLKVSLIPSLTECVLKPCSLFM
jgi:tRNA pseudouridine13 synthase